MTVFHPAFLLIKETASASMKTFIYSADYTKNVNAITKGLQKMLVAT